MMEPREIAYGAFRKAVVEEAKQYAGRRLNAMLAGTVDWTIEECIERIRAMARAGQEDLEVLAWIDAYVDHRQDQLKRLMELHED
ncbi:MAG: hypothetical protein ACRDLB_16570 [Actinomycetota bacterium]